MSTANEIRQQFIDFFCKKHGHTFVPSSPVVPLDDPTLLFSNAGMNQFKDVFLGSGSRPYKRAANTQKCIRAGGKHNDLDDVGKDTYHHTFFEMLGNWSFGDYFKKEAITWAWELLTEVWKLDKSRLHVTVFEGDPENNIPADEEAAKIWHEACGIPKERIHYGNKKDNFWEMGETGPCGPCTEIHIDRTADKSGGKLVNAGTPDCIEIWNLVFIQFNRNPDKTLTPLPARHVDTGMGFERIAAVLQNKPSNYDTDIFQPIFAAIRATTGAPPYGGQLNDQKDIAYRVIADHIRALTFALTDGATPSNLGRGYVLRSILRRAERFGWQQFGTKKPFLHLLVPSVVENFGQAFPELKVNPGRVAEIIRDEEQGFLGTLEQGMKLFQDAVQRTRKVGSKVISGDDAFQLHTTHGFFIDITEQMAAEAGLTVNRPEFESKMAEHEKISGQGRKKVVISAVQGTLPATDDSGKYSPNPTNAKVVGWVVDSSVHSSGQLKSGESAALLLDHSIFYAEQGGQVGDTGVISGPNGVFEVSDTQRLGETVLHIGRVSEGMIAVSDVAHQQIDAHIRNAIMRNHTATHLLNLALRHVLGDHVEQKGSLVDSEKTRFDFAHDKPITPAELAEIERFVNNRICADLPVHAEVTPLAEAKKIPGVRAVFGEKYPDPVRVLVIGPESAKLATGKESVEFCGGTHLRRTSQAGIFKIVSQEPVAKGVRRVTAITGSRAFEAVQSMSAILDELSSRLGCKPEELSGRVESLQEEFRKLQQQAKKNAAQDLAAVIDKLLASSEEIQGSKIIVGEIPAAPSDAMKNQVDRLRKKAGSSVVALGWKDEKANLLIAVSEDLTQKGMHAGKLIGEAAKIVDGKGGGNPTQAQAGGKNPEKLQQALEFIKKHCVETLKK